MNEVVYSNELYHHGILGMHWGIRRYQPYSTTGPRKGGKTGKEIGEAARKNKSSNNYEKPKLSEAQRKAKIKNIRKEQAKIEKKERKEEYRIKKEEKKKEYEVRKEFKDKQSFEKEKNRVLNSGDVNKIIKFNKAHRNGITTQELEAAINRINAETRLNALSPKEKTRLQKGSEKMKEISDFLDTSSRLASNGIKAYNIGASVFNSVSDSKEELPIIDTNYKNGDRQRKAEEKKEKEFKRAKEKVLNSGDIDRILAFDAKYGDKISSDELNKAFKKAELLKEARNGKYTWHND